ncbi:DUF5011 domain-containing protein [Candidatus Nomurabacteria bacterium]|nr:DUF5011 domain-containing protein [Candidatus Nomurabacteria bacterium]
MNRATCSVLLLLFFIFLIYPTYTPAATLDITQINFTSVPQTIDIDAVSARLTTQTQNAEGTSEQLDTSGMILELSSSSATGVFYNANASSCTTLLTEPFRLTMSNGSANKNFCYKDSTAGTHTLTITAEGKSWTAAVQNIIINPPPDTTAPTITLTGANPQTIEVHGSYSELGATVTDNVDTSLSATIDISTLNMDVPGNYSVKYNATDTAGNQATEVIRTVQIVDTTKPVITLTGSSTINLTVGDTYTEQGATASDNYNTGLTVTIGGDSVDTTATGTYTVTYDAVDSSGNTADQITRIVIYGPVPASSAAGSVVSGGAILPPPPPPQNSAPIVALPTISENSTNPNPAEANLAQTTQEQTILTPHVALADENVSSAKNQPAISKKEKPAIPLQTNIENQILPEALAAETISALPNDTSSNTVSIVVGTISAGILLAVWKLKFMN